MVLLCQKFAMTRYVKGSSMFAVLASFHIMEDSYYKKLFCDVDVSLEEFFCDVNVNSKV